jgi:chemotaxis protein methyltransferase CheR
LNLEAAKTLLKSRLGLSFEGHGEQSLRRAIERRLAATRATGATANWDYVARLALDTEELDALTSLLTINETYFYREPEHLRLLTDHLAPELLRTRPPGRPVRILCVGCATGEEPYSIRMALRERWGDWSDRDFAITGADLDREALARARRGSYRHYTFRTLDTRLKARWFSPTPEGGWQLADSIRASVDFLQLNLLAATYPEALGGQDLIFYRNLSIYFDAPTRHLVMGRLADLLQPEGYLIVGVAETLANDFGLLTLRDHEGIWYFARRPAAPAPRPEANPPKRTAPHRARPATTGAGAGGASPGAGSGTGTRIGVVEAGPLARPPTSRTPPPVTPSPAPSAAPTAAQRFQQALTLARAERFTAALETLAPLCAAPKADPAHLTLRAQVLHAQGDLTGAEETARQVLATDPWALEALVLLGRISRTQGRLEAAVAHLRHAIYQRPDYWPAHGELAECRRAAGQDEAARREYGIALRLLAARPEVLAQTGPLPQALSWMDLRQLYQARLARLGNRS